MATFLAKSKLPLCGRTTRLRHMLKIHHQASLWRYFFTELSLPSYCFHVGILFIFAALGKLADDKIYNLHHQIEAWW